MTISRAKTELDEADFLIIVALSLGKTQDEAGQFAGGLSDRTVRDRIERKRPAYTRLRELIGDAISRDKREFEDITREKYKELRAKLLSKGLAVQEKALDNGLMGGDLGLAVRVAEHVHEAEFGKASQVHKVEGGIAHVHVWNPMPVRLLAQQEVDMVNSQKLLNALPEGVLDGEIVESN